MLFQDLLEVVRQESALQVVADSREVQAGDVFVAVSGTQADGTDYISAAVNAGARYVLCNAEAAELSELSDSSEIKVLENRCTFVVHENTREALWELASACYGTENIWQKMRVVGVTGTNGKTTSAYLLEELFKNCGYAVGVMGTVSYRWPGHEEVAPLTTPDSVNVHRMLGQMYAAGVDIVIMEVSSHALEQERVGGIEFSGAIFSNLTQDHLDYHKDMQAYFAAKAKLFTKLPMLNKALAVNGDDAYGRELVQLCRENTKAFSFALKDCADENKSKNHVQGEILSMSTKGLHLKMQWQDAYGNAPKTWELYSPLVGAFNASNLLAVQCCALGMGLSVNDLKHLEKFYGVCGRLERVSNAKNCDVFVDYAHTPDALINVLQALQGAGFTKIITVFGCGGNRDKSKRPLMGNAVARLSQVAVVTSDNPRFEEPASILQDILPGLDGVQELEVHVEVDRRKATELALELLQQSMEDEQCRPCVLVAGKGHEDYQIIEGIKYPYSDQKNIQEVLSCK